MHSPSHFNWSPFGHNKLHGHALDIGNILLTFIFCLFLSKRWIQNMYSYHWINISKYNCTGNRNIFMHKHYKTELLHSSLILYRHVNHFFSKKEICYLCRKYFKSSLVLEILHSLFLFWWWCVCSARLFVTPWTVACQAPLPTGFLGKNTGVGCHFLPQGILPTYVSQVSCISRLILYN